MLSMNCIYEKVEECKINGMKKKADEEENERSKEDKEKKNPFEMEHQSILQPHTTMSK
jgi:hypothetical protein